MALVLVAAIAAVVVVAEPDEPGRLATSAPNSSPPAPTTSLSATTRATVPVEVASAMAAEQPTLAQQIARLENAYRNAPADAPGGRPMLAAEYAFCQAWPTNSNDTVRGTFASNFPLGQPLTEARIAEACARSDSPDARMQLGAAFTVCETTRRGPIYDLGATSIISVPRPILVFGAANCAEAGYAVADRLLDSLNVMRNIEINLRAVPRDCPTEQEATAWVYKVTEDLLGQEWTIGPPAGSATPANGCYQPFFVDRETRQVNFLVRPRP
jgi:hypothetical protein